MLIYYCNLFGRADRNRTDEAQTLSERRCLFLDSFRRTGRHKSIFIMACALLFLSCQNKSIENIEKIIGCSVEKKIVFDKKTEQWNDFNGDGGKIMTYTIKEHHFRSIVNTIESRGFNKYDGRYDESFRKSEVYPNIKSGAGFYKCRNIDDVIEILFIDTINKKMIYHYVTW